jgi:hypothetical protein
MDPTIAAGGRADFTARHATMARLFPFQLLG